MMPGARDGRILACAGRRGAGDLPGEGGTRRHPPLFLAAASSVELAASRHVTTTYIFPQNSERYSTNFRQKLAD